MAECFICKQEVENPWTYSYLEDAKGFCPVKKEWKVLLKVFICDECKNMKPENNAKKT